jgi:hypothetical protein
MKVTIHQPNFFPRLKILQKIAASDLWLILDNVQFSKHEWQNRTRVCPLYKKQPDFWLTLPVTTPFGKQTCINQVHKDPNFNLDKLIKGLNLAFSKSKHWNKIQPIMDKIYNCYNTNYLSQIDTDITIELLKITGKLPKIIYASNLSVSGKKSQLVANLCEAVHADVYLSDSGGKRYLDESVFKETKITWQKWEEPKSSWNDVSSWRDICPINYLAREGIEAFSAHLLAGDFRNESDFY